MSRGSPDGGDLPAPRRGSPEWLTGEAGDLQRHYYGTPPGDWATAWDLFKRSMRLLLGALPAPREDAFIHLTQAELDALPNYSCSLPTGVVIGKRWKRREPYSGEPHRWVLGEYVAAGENASRIEWREIALRGASRSGGGSPTAECESCHTLRNQLQTALIRVRMLEKAAGQVPDDSAVHAGESGAVESTAGQP